MTSATSTPSLSPRVDEILRAACRVVVAEGAHALRIGTVAQEAGVSRPLVHYYFATRRELVRATFAFAEERRREALEAELAELASGAERAARALERTIVPELPEIPALWNEVWSSLGEDDELRPLLQARYREWAGRIVRLLEEGRLDGSVPARVDPEEAGLRLAAIADGLDSMLYLGLVEPSQARTLLASALERELGA
ncbi:MAG: TetR/AcrR family transcriptional regulator [Thermoleophilia bacterium]|nr:TetR/AcrR family transcriptional regulator [Gaiellaceae bacterium]MDW8338445.1 TetR/AcrR family transcriptional regulator [Thermoleophilia bacterium]